MMPLKQGWGLTLIALAMVGWIAGCETNNSTTLDDAPDDQARPMVDVQEESQTQQRTMTSTAGRSVMAIPTGNRNTSVILLERTAPTEVALGEQFEYDIKVTNITSLPLNEVVVTDYYADDFQMSSASPEPTNTSGGQYLWALGTLEPGQTKTITVTGTASDVGTLRNCVAVSYDQLSCLAINVVQPRLQLAAEATPEVLTCDPITITYTVSNPGSGPARDVVIRHQLPDGLVTASKGSSTVEANVGTLPAGESMSYRVQVKANRTGNFQSQPTATASGDLSDNASVSTVVKAPALAIEKTGPGTIFLGRRATFNIEVTNTGDAVARDLVIEDSLPAGASVVSSSQGGTVSGGVVRWSGLTLNPGQSVTRSVTLEPAGIGTVTNSASARAYCASAVDDATTVEVRGIPAILLEVIDITDPVAVGETTTYRITATNQGSATDNNIRITCNLEDNMEFVSAGGATNATRSGDTITFGALSSLAPGAQASWEVTVRATGSGDMRFATSMRSDNLTDRPVQETEATNFYE